MAGDHAAATPLPATLPLCLCAGARAAPSLLPLGESALAGSSPKWRLRRPRRSTTSWPAPVLAGSSPKRRLRRGGGGPRVALPFLAGWDRNHLPPW